MPIEKSIAQTFTMVPGNQAFAIDLGANNVCVINNISVVANGTATSTFSILMGFNNTGASASSSGTQFYSNTNVSTLGFANFIQATAPIHNNVVGSGILRYINIIVNSSATTNTGLSVLVNYLSISNENPQSSQYLATYTSGNNNSTFNVLSSPATSVNIVQSCYMVPPAAGNYQPRLTLGGISIIGEHSLSTANGTRRLISRDKCPLYLTAGAGTLTATASGTLAGLYTVFTSYIYDPLNT